MINKKPHHSKKFLLAATSLALAFTVWLASYVGVIVDTEAAAHLVSLATLITGILGTIAVAGITGQSFVDLRLANNFTGASVNETRKEDVDIRITSTPDNGTITRFARQFSDDQSYRPIGDEGRP